MHQLLSENTTCADPHPRMGDNQQVKCTRWLLRKKKQWHVNKCFYQFERNVYSVYCTILCKRQTSTEIEVL